MPRTGRAGGTRVGTPGAAYSNRTDMNANRSLPVRAATGQTYGDAGAQMAAQHQVPMAAPAPPPAPSGPAAAAPGGMGAPSPPPAVPPGAHGPIDRPTERPGEPVTAGAPLGAGPGPEAIPPGPSNPQNTNLSALLSSIAQSSGSPAIANLARNAAAGGQ